MVFRKGSFSFPIEAGQVLAFTRAIGADCNSEAIPLTFVMAADQFDPLFDRRPSYGETWQASAIESLFHVEQTIDYFSPLRTGMQLTASKKAGRRWKKQGRKAGELEFIETITELRSEHNDLLLRSSWVDVKTQRSHSSVTQNQPGHSSSPVSTELVPTELAPPETDTPSPRIEHITRTQIVMYVGTTGDFHPLHHDEEYAVQLGYPSIFAPGMLTMALCGQAVLSLVPQEEIRQFSGRFRAQVWPGDELLTDLYLAPEDPHVLRATTSNQLGTAVFEGKVTLGSNVTDHTNLT